VTPAQLRDLTRWVEHFAAASDGLKMKVIAAILAQYAGRNFYSTTDVAAAAQAAAAISNAQSQTAAGLAGEYLAVTTGIMLDQAVPAPTLLLPALRNGVDMNSVFERPAKLFRRPPVAGRVAGGGVHAGDEPGPVAGDHEHHPGAA
jgi:hypothetical protein